MTDLYCEKKFIDYHSISLAYCFRKGQKNPGFVWLNGYRSDMEGTKAIFVDQLAKKENRSCLRFDYSGNGESSGDFSQRTLSNWLDESLYLFQKFCSTKPQILIGSSMGGWIALRMYQERLKYAANIAAIVLVAPAPDFTVNLLEPRLTKKQKESLDTKGYFSDSSTDEEGGLFFYKKFIQDSYNHLVLKKPLEIDCPVFILQGKKDEAVPHDYALELMNFLPQNHVTFTSVIDGDHRLSRPKDLLLLEKILCNYLHRTID